MGIFKVKSQKNQHFPPTVFSFFIYFIKKQLSKILWAQFFCFAWAIDSTIFPVLFGRVIDALNGCNHIKEQAWPVLKGPILQCLVFWIVLEFFFRANGFLLAKIIPKFEADIRTNLFAHIQKYSCKYFANNFSGNIGQKISDLTLCASRVLHTFITSISSAILSAILVGVLMYKESPKFCILIEIWLFLHFLICYFLSRHSSRLSAFHSDIRSQLSGHIIDSLTNYLTVKIFSRHQFELDSIKKYQYEEQKRHTKTLFVIENYRSILGLMTFLLPGVLINMYVYLGWKEGLLSVGSVVAIFHLTWNMCNIVWVCGNDLPTLFADIGMIKQGLTLIQSEPDVQDAPSATRLVAHAGAIDFKNVSFGHDELLFQNFTTHIAPGQKVGLVGYSGSGKSTFVTLLLRLYDIQGGHIYIDGQDIRTVTQESLRKAITYVPQHPNLFHRTVSENIRYGKLDVTKEEIQQAAVFAHAHDFIAQMPKAYDTMVGERGVKLSGGQRQRIEIARSFLCGDLVKIMILDEATSALDSVTERDIQKSFHTFMKGKTVIVVAHRLSTLLQMDRILVFDKGKIVEDASHFELLSKKGLYTKLWDSQIEGFLPETAL